MIEPIGTGRVSLSLYPALKSFGEMGTLHLERFSTDSSARVMTTVLEALSTRRTGNEPSAIGESLFRVSFSFLRFTLRKTLSPG